MFVIHLRPILDRAAAGVATQNLGIPSVASKREHETKKGVLIGCQT